MKVSSPSWTLSILTNLKPKVTEIKDGILKWILSTAMPLNPGFQLYFNGDILESSKESIEPRQIWQFGVEDVIVEKDDLDVGEYFGQSCVNLPTLQNVTGRVELYDESLLKGAKSERIGRNHGIFVMVRDRLINIDDPLFGMDALSHGVFNRTRIIIHADDLDQHITSTREAIKDSPARNDLVIYTTPSTMH